MGLGGRSRKAKKIPIKLAYNERKVVGMYCGNYHTQLLVEDQNGERELLGWGYGE